MLYVHRNRRLIRDGSPGHSDSSQDVNIITAAKLVVVVQLHRSCLPWCTYCLICKQTLRLQRLQLQPLFFNKYTEHTTRSDRSRITAPRSYLPLVPECRFLFGDETSFLLCISGHRSKCGMVAPLSYLSDPPTPCPLTPTLPSSRYFGAHRHHRQIIGLRQLNSLKTANKFCRVSKQQCSQDF